MCLDDRIVFAYDDPDPLPGGHVALWTFRNGNVYALLRTAAKRRTNGIGIHLAACESDADAPWQAIDPHRVSCRRLDDGRYRVTNRMGGGRFAVRWKMKKPVDLRSTPLLRIPFRPDGGAKVGLHVRISGKAFIIPVTAPTEETFEIQTQADVKRRAWQVYDSRSLRPPYIDAKSCYMRGGSEIRVNLLDEVKRRFRSGKWYRLEALAIANTSNKDYLMAGFTGNGSGTSYILGDALFTRPGHDACDDEEF